MVTEEARRKTEAEVARFEVEWTSLVPKIRATKDEESSLQSQADKDKEAMEKDYKKALELIFAYSYGCCFKHNICVNQPNVLDGMLDSYDPLPPEFFVNTRCPPAPTATKATAVEVY